MLNELTENLSAANQHFIDELDWYFLPSLNPDGYAFTQDGDRMWRKTRSALVYSLLIVLSNAVVFSLMVFISRKDRRTQSLCD